jgi:hypothetical protein
VIDRSDFKEVDSAVSQSIAAVMSFKPELL